MITVFFGALPFVVIKSTSGEMNSAPPNKSVYLSAKRDCSFMQTVKSWKLVNKDRLSKLKDFAIKIHSMFGNTYVCESIFSIL